MGSRTTRDPRTVPGFDRAVELGLIPQVPDVAPRPVTVNSRHLLLASVAAAFAGLIVLLTAVNRGTWDGPAYGLLGALVAAGVVALLAWQRRASWREIEAGYCRLDTMVALYSRDPEGRFPASRMRGAPWDLRGLWRLDDSGEPARAPVAGVLPAGHYPSPHHTGELELWTGAAWAYRYREPAQPFL